MKQWRAISFLKSAIAVLVLLDLAVNTVAHTLPLSFLKLSPGADYLHLELTFNPFELTFFSELDANKDGRVDISEWEAEPRNATRKIVDCLSLTVRGSPAELDVAGIVLDFDSHHATLRAHYAVDARRGEVTVASHLAELTSGSHFTQVTFAGKSGVQFARLDSNSATAVFQGTERLDRVSSGVISFGPDESAAADAVAHFVPISAGTPDSALMSEEESYLVFRFVRAVLLTLGMLFAGVWFVSRWNVSSVKKDGVDSHPATMKSRRTL